MAAYADKIGRGAMKEDINYVAGWVAGQMTPKHSKKTGKDANRAKLVETLSKGFTVDSKGHAAPSPTRRRITPVPSSSAC